MEHVRAERRQTKGERTRARILDVAGPLFNARGYRTSSVQEVMAAAGLQKGGIYNHFASREDLVLAAYDRNTSVLGDLIRGALASSRDAVDRLRALVEVYRQFAVDPPFPGGCPLLNTTVESHGGNERLRDRAREVMDDLRDGTVVRIVRRGIERGELRDDVDPDTVGSVVIAGIEGGLLLTDLYGDPVHMHRVCDHLVEYTASLAPPRRRRT